MAARGPGPTTPECLRTRLDDPRLHERPAVLRIELQGERVESHFRALP